MTRRSPTPLSRVADGVTALVITYNEEANIGRVLAQLGWAPRILVVDSGSTDATLDIVRRCPNVEVVHREFDSFAAQCNFGLAKIESPWVLSIDADYVLSDELVAEIGELRDDPAVEGYRLRFVYKVGGRPLRGSLYPPRVSLYRAGAGRYVDEGHAHRLHIAGRVIALRAPVFHDDRKPLARWLAAQQRYATREAAMLLETATGGRLSDKLRRAGWIMPVAAPVYALILRGCLFSGLPGWSYALQRAYAELLIALELTERRLARRTEGIGRPQEMRRA